MEAEVSGLVGAARGERAPEERPTDRNGYRARPWATRAGELELQIPKLRRGSYFPSFLEAADTDEERRNSGTSTPIATLTTTRKPGPSAGGTPCSEPKGPRLPPGREKPATPPRDNQP
jgi:transposase-like protein